MKKMAGIGKTVGVRSKDGTPTDEQIRHRAYEIFLARGATPGQDVEDWLRAERELSVGASPDNAV